jgi:hypothetical protein
MKTLISVLALATLIATPAFIVSANAAPNDRREVGTYQGYPLSEWYRGDGW